MPRLAPVTSRTCSKKALLLARPSLHCKTPRQPQGVGFMGQFTDLRSYDGFAFPAYVVQPAGKPRGGIVVLQEIFGVNSHIRSVADGYAKAGYLVVAPATFHRVKPGVDIGYGPD